MNDLVRLIDATPIERELIKVADKSLAKNPYENAKISAYRRCFETIVNAPTIFAKNLTKSCNGCIHNGKYENEVENGLNSPCTKCARRAPDNYERVQWINSY